MKLGVASNIVLDQIDYKGGQTASGLGGPPCYCGLTARKFKFGVNLVSKVGDDFPDSYLEFLKKSGLDIGTPKVGGRQTTSFILRYNNAGGRELVLKSNCAHITPEDIENVEVDAWLVSPAYNEVPPETLSKIQQINASNGGMIMLDPQGYLRSADQQGNVTLVTEAKIDLSGIAVIKTDPEELSVLTGGLSGLEGMTKLKGRGVKTVLATEHRRVSLLHENTLYWIKLREIEAADATGAGDILSAAFVCALLRENDALWALCFGAGALISALESGRTGIEKIPSMSSIEQNASYFYNAVGFKKL